MNKRLPLIISALFVLMSSFVIGQSDNCDAASMMLTPGVLTTGDNTLGTADEDYSSEFVCTSGDFEAQVWYQYTASSFSAELTFIATAITDASIFVVEGCGPCAGPGHIVFYTCDVANGATEMAGLCTEPGTTYWIGISSFSGDAGLFDIEIDESTNLDASNSTCGAAMAISDGITNVTNFCTTQNYLFFEYTVQTGPSITVSTSNNSPVIPVCSGSSIHTILPDCSDPEATIPTTIPVSECLAVGQTIIIRVETAQAHEIEIEIVDPDPLGNPSEPNDICTDAFDMYPGSPLLCSANAGLSGNGAACPDTEGAGCNDTDPGIWGFFTVDPTVPFFNVTGSGFQLFEGPDCNNLTSLICDVATSGIVPDYNTTYYVLITGDGTSTFNVAGATNALGIPDPTNDDCASADALSLGLNSGLTNLCSSTDINLGTCGATQSEATVWYEYTPSQAVTFVEITLAAATVTSPGFAIYDACGGALLDELCSEGTITLECSIENQFWIQVGSATINGGDFDLTITEGNPVNVNDLCTTAAADPENTLADCTPATISGDNTDSCPESFGLGGCNIDTEPTVWEELTLPAGTVSLEITNISAGFSVTIWDGCGGSAFGPSCLTADAFVNITPGLTTVFVSINGPTEGPFSFDVLAVVPPANDACADAEMLGSGTSVTLTNACATADVALGCAATQDEATVWYSYTIASPIDEITITLAGTGTSILNPAFQVLDGNAGCNGTFIPGITPACSGGTITIPCPPVGDLLIEVGSAFDDAGEFQITITEGTATPPNDLCMNAATDPENTLTACTESMITGDNNNSCPEAFSLAGCNIDIESTVWEELTLPAGTVALNISGITPNFNVTVWSDCTTPLGPSCLTADDMIAIAAGTTSVLVSVSSDPTLEGAYAFTVLPVVPPVNDECADAIGINSGANTGLTNECATADVLFNTCGGGQEEATVWYSYTIANQIDEITINLAGSGANITAPAFMVLDGTGGCSGVFLDEACAEGDLIIECPPVGDIFIMVGSTFDNAGEFDITITEGNPSPTNDLCDMAAVEPALVACVAQEISGTNEFACPEDFTLAGCNIDVDPTVWHEITVPAGTTALEIEVTSGPISVTIWESPCPPGGTANGPVCINGMDVVNVPGAGTYFISVSTIDGNEGAYTFDITAIVPPANDDCAMAELITAGATSGSNICSTPDIAPGCTASTDIINTVWYEYVVPAGVKSVTISIAGTGGIPISGVHAAAVDGCPPGSSLIEPGSETCAGEDIVLSCPDPGVSVFILVGSTSDNEGDFTITITEDNPTCTYGNDECADAEPLPNDPITNMGEECTSGCNELACPDPEIDGVCGVTTNNVVWFEVTTDAFDPSIETFIIAEISNEVDFNPVVGIFTGSCPPVSGLTSIGCNPGANVTVSNAANAANHPMPNTTYLIAVANSDDTQSGGTFDLCVEVVQGCANDDCVSALTITDGVTQVTTTNGCTEDIGVQACGGPGGAYEASAWYNYTVPAGVTAILVEATGATGALVFDAIVDIDCNDPVPFGSPSENVDCNFSETLLTCVQEGEVYTFFIGSEISGVNFDLTITGLPPDDPQNPSPDNDLCTDPEVIPITDDCAFVTVTVNNENACEETFSVTPCVTGLFNENPTVWFEVTLPADATGLDFDNINNGTYLSVFDDVCPITGGTPSLGCMDQSTASSIVGLTGGNTYLIAVAHPVESSSHSFDILAITPPENDGPCPTDPDFSPADITGGSYSGTTCCALGFNDLDAAGNPLDLENIACTGTLTQDNVVWFIYQWIDDGSDGIEINFNPTGISGSASLEVYTATMNAGCAPPIPATAADVVGFSCDAVNDDPIRIGCPDPDVYYYIKLSTADETCGEYTISVDPATSQCSELADECVDAPMLVTQTPNACADGEIPLSVDGCLDLACPEDVFTDCGQDQGPTVWFQITIDDTDANGLYTQVDAPGFDAVWAVYEGTSCDDMVLVGDLDEDNPGSIFPCSFSDGDPGNLFTVPIGTDPATGDDFTYWVSVTAVGPVSDPNFELSYGATLGCIACSGNTAQDCDNGTFEAFVDGELSEGPFCAGAEVEICLSFNYNTTGTGNDWLHGIIPTFGAGWDVEEIDFPSIDLGNPNWVWADADGGCAPFLNGYSLPNACTFTNAEGLLQICNTSCNPSCDCELGAPLPDGSPLPSGWFWSSPGGSPTCAGACTPSDDWGVPAGTNVDVDICMTLIVKSFDDPDECEDNKDLKIFFQTTSDAISGCWVDSSPCIIDPSFESPSWEVDCDTSPPAVADIVPICSGTMAMTQVSIEGGLNGEIEIEIDPDTSPDILGQTEDVFTGGVGTIMDELINCGTTVDTARYIAFAIVDGFQCPGVPVEVKIPVFPKIVIDPQPNPYIVCLPHTIENLPANVSGGTGSYDVINWFWGDELTGTLIGSGPVLTSYPLSMDGIITIQVIDSGGCTETQQLVVDIFEKLEPEINIDATEVCKDISFLGADAFVSIGTVDDWFWYSEDADGNPVDIFTGGNTGSNVNIDPSDPSVEPGKYTIFAEASNDVGCVGIDSVCLTIYPLPIGEIVQQPSTDCSSEVELCVEFYDENGADIYGNGPDDNGNGIPDLFEDDNGDPDFTVTWFASFIPGGSTTNELCFLTSTQSFYDVEIESANGCIGIFGISEIVLPMSTPPTIEPDTICLGEMTTLSVMPQDYDTYEWEDADGNPIGGGSAGPMINVAPVVSSTYFLTVTDANECTGETSVTIEVNPLPDPQFSGNLSICAGQETEITALGDPALFDFNWLDGSGGSIGVDSFVVISTTGTYTLELTNEFGCIKDTMFTVITAAELDINISGSDICDDDGCTTLNGGAGFDMYTWTDMDGNEIVSGPTEQTLEVCDPGDYILIAAQGVCSGVDTITISQMDSPIIDIADGEACNITSGGSLWFVNFDDLVLSSAGGTWSSLTDPSIVLSPLDSVSFAGLPQGDYEFIYTTNTAMAPCADVSDTITIVVGPCDCPNPNVNNPVDLCNADNNYDLNTLIGPNTDAGQWVFLNGPEATVLDGDSMFVYNGVTPGMYEFAYELVPVPIGTCTELADTIVVTVVEPPVAEVEMFACVCETQSTAGCNNGSTMLNLDDFVLSGTGQWIDPGIAGLAWTPPMLDFSGLPTAPVVLTFQTTDAVAPCNNVEYTLTVDVTDCNCPNVSVGTVDDQCNDDAVIDLSLIEDVNIAPGSWVEAASNPSTGVLAGSTATLTGQPTGLYVFTYVLDTPVAGCDDESTPVIISLSEPPVVTVMNAFVCNVAMGMDTTNIDLNSLVSDPTIGVWTDNTGAPVLDTNIDFNGQAVGTIITYTFTTNTAVAPCADQAYPVDIEVVDCACPPLSFANPPLLCSEPDGSVDLDLLILAPTPAGTWNLVSSPTGSTANLSGSVLNATGSVAGIYTVEFQPDGELPICAETLDVTVSVMANATLEPSLIICTTNSNGEDTDYDLNDAITGGDTGGVWTDSDGNVISDTNIEFLGEDDGAYTYTYTVESDDPCDPFIGSVTINAGNCACPVVFDLETFCSTGGTIELFDIFNISFPGMWLFADGTPVPNAIIDYTGFPDGISTVFFEMDDPGTTCLTQYPVNFNIVSPEDLGEPAEPLRICEGEDVLVNLLDLLPNAATGGMWIETSVDGSTPGAFDANAGTFSTGNESAASYMFQYELQSAQPCPSVAETVQVIIEGLPAVEAGETQTLTCDNNTAALGNDAITSQGINFVYQWTEAGGATIPNDTESSIVVNEPGVYNLVVTDINTGCTIEDFVTVNVDGNIPTVAASFTEISCFGAGDGSIEVAVTGGVAPIQYSIDGGSSYSNNNIFENLGPGNFAISVLDDNGCETGLNIEITQPDRVTVDLGSDITLNEETTDTLLTFTSNFPNDQIANVVWTDEDGLVLCEGTYDECREWMVGIAEATVYCVEITTVNGCVATDCIQIRAIIVEDCYVPNIFSPNNDGQNDSFFMQCDEFATSVNKFFVFDRWGELVYGIEGILPNDPSVGWDGTLNDQDVEQGVYAYYIEVEFNNDPDNVEIFAGDITVVR